MGLIQQASSPIHQCIRTRQSRAKSLHPSGWILGSQHRLVPSAAKSSYSRAPELGAQPPPFSFFAAVGMQQSCVSSSSQLGFEFPQGSQLLVGANGGLLQNLACLIPSISLPNADFPLPCHAMKLEGGYLGHTTSASKLQTVQSSPKDSGSHNHKDLKGSWMGRGWERGKAMELRCHQCSRIGLECICPANGTALRLQE